MAVLLYHVRYRFFVDYADLASPTLLDKAFYTLTSFGHDAVMFFFVLSGYFIATTVANAVRVNRWSWSQYTVNRLVRLYVVLIPALTFGAIFDLAGLYLHGDNPIYTGETQVWKHDYFDVNERLSVSALVGNALFLQTIFVPPFGSNDPLWSLSFEFWYYALFPCGYLMIYHYKTALTRVACLAALLAMLAIVNSTIILYFGVWLLGAIASQLPLRASFKSNNQKLVTGLALSCAALGTVAGHIGGFTQYLGGSRFLVDFVIGIGAAFLVYVLRHHEAPLSSKLYIRIATVFAALSFTLYLSHMPLLVFLRSSFISEIQRPWEPGNLTLLAFACICCILLAYSCLVYWLTERHTIAVKERISYFVEQVSCLVYPSFHQKVDQYVSLSSAPVVLDARVIAGVFGGPDKTILNSPRFLKPLGYNNVCLYYHPPNDAAFERLQPRAADAQSLLIGVVDRGALDLSLIKKTVDICRQQNVAIWHAHDYKTHLIGILARRSWPMKMVTTLHGWGHLGWKMGLYYVVGQSCLWFYDEVIAVSQELLDDARRWRVPEKRLHLIHNAIDAQDYRRSLSKQDARGKIRSSFDACREQKDARQRPLIGSLGRLSPEKGFDALIDAVAVLRDRGIELELWIAGDGAFRSSLEQQIERLGLKSNVVLIGHLADPRVMLQALDGFVLSSHREGLPNVVLEAMALEVPVISTRVGEVPVMLDEGSGGLLIEKTDSQLIANAIERLVGDPDLQRSFSLYARRTVEQRYDFGRRMQEIGQLYDRLLNRSPNGLSRTALPNQTNQETG